MYRSPFIRELLAKEPMEIQCHCIIFFIESSIYVVEEEKLTCFRQVAPEERLEPIIKTALISVHLLRAQGGKIYTRRCWRHWRVLFLRGAREKRE